MGVIDEVLPTLSLEAIQVLLSLYGALTLLGIINQWLIICVFILTICLFLFRRYFAKIVNILRRFEANGKKQLK